MPLTQIHKILNWSRASFALLVVISLQLPAVIVYKKMSGCKEWWPKPSDYSLRKQSTTTIIKEVLVYTESPVNDSLDLVVEKLKSENDSIRLVNASIFGSIAKNDSYNHFFIRNNKAILNISDSIFSEIELKRDSFGFHYQVVYHHFNPLVRLKNQTQNISNRQKKINIGIR